jgi:hypothetical protein
MPRNPSPQRRPKSPADAAFHDQAKAGGWTITRRAWPDWWCTRTNEQGDTEVAAVEVLRHRGRKVKREQRAVMRILAAAGIPCYQWSPEHGYRAVPPF